MKLKPIENLKKNEIFEKQKSKIYEMESFKTKDILDYLGIIKTEHLILIENYYNYPSIYLDFGSHFSHGCFSGTIHRLPSFNLGTEYNNNNEININNNENIKIDKKENDENDKNVEKNESNNYESNNLKENSKQKKEKIIPKRNENKENRYYKNYHSNDKIKSNNIMLYKNIKNKINVNTKAIEDKEKELIKLKKEYNNLKVNVIEKDINNKSYFNTNYNTNAKKKTWNNPILHKNGTSLIGNNNDNKKKQARRHKNKSMDINDKVSNSNYLNKIK